MYDSFNRKINYLRISVTDRCNLRCEYCMPENGVKQLMHHDILTFEEIIEFTKVAIENGINKVRITGGEPLVRKNVVQLVAMLAQLKGIDDLSMTTNAILLEEYAEALAKAGLQRINISLDTIDEAKFKTLTRGGDIKHLFRGIEAAIKHGFNPIKINCVIDNSSDEPDAIAVKNYGIQHGLEVRFIKLMNLHKGVFSIVEGGNGGDCKICNRLRLTADGMLKPCLFSNNQYSIKTLGYKQAIEKAIYEKPKCGNTNNTNEFVNIGG